MPRKLRLQYPGAMYHVMSRGNRCGKIFLDDVDRQDFLKTLAEACQKTGWQVHAYCLMRNHFHMVLETPNANLVEGMRWFLSAYTVTVRRSRLTLRVAGLAGWRGETTIISIPHNPATLYPQRESWDSQRTSAQRAFAAGVRP